MHNFIQPRLLLGLLAVLSVPAAGSESHHHVADTVTEGAHGGRLLVDGDFAVELLVDEAGGEARLQAYVSNGRIAVVPRDVELSVELSRLGDRRELVRFTTMGATLVGDRVIAEPHSFEVHVAARYAGVTHRWEYQSYEGRAMLSPEAARVGGVRTEIAGAAVIRATLPLAGRAIVDPERLARATARYGGVVREVRKRLGDRVERDEVVAVVESNESLQRYDIRAALGGIVLHKHVAVGETVNEGGVLLVIADLSTVWAEFHAHPADLSKLRRGQAVFVGRGVGSGDERVHATIDWLAPLADESSRTTAVRAGLANADGEWRPGEFLRGDVAIDETAVPVAVRDGALQRFNGFDVVYRNEGDIFEATPVVLGRRGDGWVEVVDGLRAGQRYVSGNSFLVKAESAKHGASHDH